MVAGEDQTVRGDVRLRDLSLIQESGERCGRQERPLNLLLPPTCYFGIERHITGTAEFGPQDSGPYEQQGGTLGTKPFSWSFRAAATKSAGRFLAMNLPQKRTQNAPSGMPQRRRSSTRCGRSAAACWAKRSLSTA